MAISKAFAELVKPGDTLLLSGEIGSGKTFFSRILIKQMMQNQGVVLEDIPSPTFNIVQIYDTIWPSVWHLDLYRLSTSAEVIDLDLESALENSVCLIEWPKKLGIYTPKRNLLIAFEETEEVCDARNITFEFNGPDWEHIITGLNERSLVEA